MKKAEKVEARKIFQREKCQLMTTDGRYLSKEQLMENSSIYTLFTSDRLDQASGSSKHFAVEGLVIESLGQLHDVQKLNGGSIWNLTWP